MPDGKIDIEINYTLLIPNRGGVFGNTERQTNLSDWYPYVPYYDNEKGWLIHEPSKVGEYLVYDKADFNLKLKYNLNYL